MKTRKEVMDDTELLGRIEGRIKCPHPRCDGPKDMPCRVKTARGWRNVTIHQERINAYFIQSDK